VLNLKTLNDIFFTVTSAKRVRAILAKDAAGAWKPISSAQIYQRVRAVTAALERWGVGKGDRVAILAENRWEWGIADFAALAMGVIDVPIYPTLTAEQTGVLLTDSATRVAFVSTRAQYEKLASTRTKTALEHIVIMDEEGTPDAVLFSSLIGDADESAERDAAFDRRAYDVAPEDPATLIYTSGTTGEPKGVVLTHGVRYYADGLMHFVSAAVAYNGAASGLCDLCETGDCGLLRCLRPAAGGDGGGEADDHGGGAARL
jgi:long-chain acyl-CoA synthetase